MLKKGIGASPGIAIAKAFVYEKVEADIPEYTVEDTAAELERLQKALDESKVQLEAVKERAAEALGEEEAEVFDAHLLILDDPEFSGQMKAAVEGENKNAAKAAADVVDMSVAIFEAMDDPYFRGRAADYRDIGTRIINNILGIENIDLSNMAEDTILIAEDLAPSDTAQMDKKHVKGFATDIGSRTSHTAIMARSLEIPAVLGLGDITTVAKTGDTVIVDGSSGDVIVNPTKEELEKYSELKGQYDAYRAELAQLKDAEAETKDGHRVELVGNIGSPNDVEGVLENGGAGVGLYRTEFLYMDSDTMPDEDKQFIAYKKVIQAFGDKPVIIRTLDIGGDKKLPYLPLEEEMNPFLGLRAIRLCFENEDMFKTQLRAILRASAFGNAKIMFPMISGVEQVIRAKAILQECMKELDEEQIDYNKDIQIGIMVEIPAAAVTADIIIPEVSFFSIGTNDLCQYTLAVDRMNQNISYLYDPYHPAILRLVKNCIQASHSEVGKFTGMCGEFAGDPYATLLLMGLGLDEFSMSASSIPQVKKIVRSVTYQQAQDIANHALTLTTGAEVQAYVKEELEKLGITVM